MDISQIEGYEMIIEMVMNEMKIKDGQKSKIDKLLRNALREGQVLDIDLRLLLDGGDYIYED